MGIGSLFLIIPKVRCGRAPTQSGPRVQIDIAAVPRISWGLEYF
jgi:hypothetical protein